MKCREAQYWLYSFRPNASWPVDVVGHLQNCPKCQLLQTKLKQIDQGVDKLTSAAGDPGAVVHLLDRIAKTPQLGTPAIPAPANPWVWLKLGAFAGAAAALILIGWLVGRLVDGTQIVPGEPQIKTVTELRDRIQEKIVHSQAERILFSKLLKRNAELVNPDSQASDRLNTLLDMADDCQLHAWTLIDDGPSDSLPMTIDMYAQLLQEGVLPQLAQAPAESRPALQQTARARLHKLAKANAGPKGLAAALAEQQVAMQNATDETIKLVDQPEKAPARPKQTSQAESLSPSATLVRFAVTISAETDPVVKADRCTNYVKRLLPTMNLYLSEDSVPKRGEMGQQFGELIQFGVYRPLELASAKEPNAPPTADTKRIFASVEETVDSMMKNLKQAPEETREGFERAIQKGKGKGPREIRGTLRKFDAGKSTITVATRIQGKDIEMTYAISRDLLKGMTTKSAGASVQLRLSDDRRTVIEIRSDRDDDGERNNK